MVFTELPAPGGGHRRHHRGGASPTSSGCRRCRTGSPRGFVEGATPPSYDFLEILQAELESSAGLNYDGRRDRRTTPTSARPRWSRPTSAVLPCPAFVCDVSLSGPRRHPRQRRHRGPQLVQPPGRQVYRAADVRPRRSVDDLLRPRVGLHRRCLPGQVVHASSTPTSRSRASPTSRRPRPGSSSPGRPVARRSSPPATSTRPPTAARRRRTPTSRGRGSPTRGRSTPGQDGLLVLPELHADQRRPRQLHSRIDLVLTHGAVRPAERDRGR